MSENMNLDDFWSNDEWGAAYEREPLTEQTLRTVETQSGYRLPASYVSLLMQHNGGALNRTCVKGSWAVIEGLYGISSKSAAWYKDVVEVWGYPAIGVPISDGPSGHTMFFLDYRECGPDGEPKVAEVDQEFDYKITVLADSFAEFLGKLVDEEENDSDEQIAENMRRLADPYRDVAFSSVDPDMRPAFRRAVWGEWSWGLVIGWDVVLLAGIIFLGKSSAFGWKPQKLTLLLTGWLILHTVMTAALAVGCCKKSKKPCKYYCDRVARCWEENGKRYYCLEKSKKEKYTNNIAAKPGDDVIVYVLEKDEIVVKKDGKREPQ